MIAPMTADLSAPATVLVRTQLLSVSMIIENHVTNVQTGSPIGDE